MTDPLVDVLLPSLAILVSASIAVALAVLERRAARRARDQERVDRICEDILEGLSFFVSANPLAEEMSSELRRLRSRIALLQTLASTGHRLVGLWLAREVETALPRYSEGMLALQAYVDPQPSDILRAFAPAHTRFHDSMMRLSSWMRGDIADDVLSSRIQDLNE